MVLSRNMLFLDNKKAFMDCGSGFDFLQLKVLK